MSKYLQLSSRISLTLILLLALAFRVSAQTEEPVNIDPLTVLPKIGRTETLSGTRLFKLYPLEDGTFIQPLDFPGASSFRIHFSVLNRELPQDATWEVKIINFDNTQERWTFKPDRTLHEFWSGEIKGSRARAVVIANAAAGNLQIIIDKVAYLQAITTPQTEINHKLKPIDQTSNSIRKMGRSVARLLIQRDGDEVTVPCTGFLVGRDLLITNRHCIRSGSEARNTDVQFDYDHDGQQPLSVGVKDLILTSCDLDFVLLRLDKSFACQTTACGGPYERAPLFLTRNDTLTIGQKLIAIQHPDGEAKQVSQEGCVVDQLLIVGSSSTMTDFAHKCDTKGGSSGTPIQLIGIGDMVGAVVGLHHLGVRIDNVQEANPKLINRAVSSKQIINYINQVKPALISEMAIQ